MFFHTIAFGDKYSGLTCLALMWFVPTPPERSAIMKVVLYDWGDRDDPDDHMENRLYTSFKGLILTEQNECVSLSLQGYIGLTLPLLFDCW